MELIRKRFISSVADTTHISVKSENNRDEVIFYQDSNMCIKSLYANHSNLIAKKEVKVTHHTHNKKVITITEVTIGDELYVLKNKEGDIRRYVYKNLEDEITHILDEKGRTVFLKYFDVNRSFNNDGESMRQDMFCVYHSYDGQIKNTTYVSKEGKVFKYQMPSEDNNSYKHLMAALRYSSNSEYIFGVSNDFNTPIMWSLVDGVFYYTDSEQSYRIKNIELHNGPKINNMFNENYIRVYENEVGNTIVEMCFVYDLISEGYYKGSHLKFEFESLDKFILTTTKPDGSFYVKYIENGYEVKRMIHNGEKVGGFVLDKKYGFREDVYICYNEEGEVDIKPMSVKHDNRDNFHIDTFRGLVKLQTMLNKPVEEMVKPLSEVFRFNIYDVVGFSDVNSAELYIYDKIIKGLGSVNYSVGDKNSDLLSKLFGVRKHIFTKLNKLLHDEPPLEFDKHNEKWACTTDHNRYIIMDVIGIRQGKHSDEICKRGIYEIFGEKRSGVCFIINVIDNFKNKDYSLSVIRNFNISVFIGMPDDTNSDRFISLGTSDEVSGLQCYIDKELTLMSTSYNSTEDIEKRNTNYKDTQVYDLSRCNNIHTSIYEDDDTRALHKLYEELEVVIPSRNKGGK